MRILWKLLKVMIGIAIAVPVGLVLLALAFGVLGTVVGIAILLAKLACLGLVSYGVYRVARFFMSSGPRTTSPPVTPAMRELPARDPYYEAAMRELDSEIGRP
jgi:hypothetical protein